VTLRATADDLRYQQDFGTQATYVIQGASATIDSMPWASGASSIPLLADDGAFDEKSEPMSAAIDTTGLAPGRHLVYVQATNQLAGGTSGAPDAVFLDIDDPTDRIFGDDFEAP
jgi:carboxypeptidase T